ncbi:GTP-binding protein [Bacillus shivajii]|uniref:CobW family GTP-binding protein n=1 Tax=Bacillus shivajii TaxID=1983719 RepID=UPI001CFC2811|nr:GTP-binding protein [Bacillus shivajii]UCZ54204.1 GTP-binding protein [Bacillus shivajii]
MKGQGYKRIPVSVLTGFLGSGKTTLLNRILQDQQDERIAVIVNEFGDAGIDQQLVIGAEEEIIEFNNGCLCCKMRSDLIKTLYALIQAVEEDGYASFDRVIIETTGLAEPAPIAQSFFIDNELSEIYHLDSIVTVIDSHHFQKQLSLHNEVGKQAAFADILILNKTDLVSSEEIESVVARLTMMNPTAMLIESEYGKVNISELLNQFSFDLDKKLKVDPHFLDASHHHHHNQEIQSIVLRTYRSVDMKRFESWFNELIDEKGEELYRYKGILSADGFDKRIIFQGIHMLFGAKAGERWPDEDHRKSEFVVIGKNLDHEWFQERFEQCYA